MSDMPDTRPEGSPEDWDDEWLWLLAIIRAEDERRAAGLWQQAVPQHARLIVTPRDLLRETPQVTGLLKSATLAFADALAERMKALTGLLFGGGLKLPEWQDAMGRLVKHGGVAMGLIASGNPAAQLAADRGELPSRFGQPRVVPESPEGGTNLSEFLAGMLAKLGGFAKEIGAGAMTAERAVSRAALYGANLNPLYEFAKVKVMSVAGFTECQNNLRPAEHCDPDPDRPDVPSCPQETARGWVLIKEMSLPGRRVCFVNCRCFLTYRRPE